MHIDRHSGPRRLRRARARAGLASVLAASAVAMGACEGENLFQNPGGVFQGGDERPPEVEIQEPTSPAANPVGDSVLIRAALSDPDGIDSVVFTGVSLRGDPDLGTDEVIERFETKKVVLPQPTDTVVTRYLVAAADSTRETALLIATAYDAGGNAAADTVDLILGGPRVRLLNIVAGQTVQAGLGLAVRIEAVDPQGIVQVQLDVDGVSQATIIRSFNPPVDSVAVDTSFVIPAGTQGLIGVTATARSTLDVAGQAGPIALQVVSGGQGDTIRPSSRVVASAPARMELGDQVQVQVNGADDTQGSGIQRVGYTVVGISPERGDTVVMSGERSFDPPRTGNVAEVFGFAPFNVDSLSLPDTLVFEITGYVIDASNNCSASVQSDSLTVRGCVSLPTGEVVAENLRGLRLVRSIVAGRTVRLPNPGRIFDAVVDTTRRNLLLSNIDRDQVEVFRLLEERFLRPVPVGSEPWGLSLNRGEDTLIVANSGGTNLSNVWLGPVPASPSEPAYEGHFEDPGRRLLTPDVVLFDIERKIDDTGALSFKVFLTPDEAPPGFSDRPQFMAVDSTGRILYSTKTTLLGDVGTLRKAFVPPSAGARLESVIFLDFFRLTDSPDFTAVGNVDDVQVVLGPPDSLGTQDAQVIFVDHVPGFPDQTITGGPSTMSQAAFDIAQQGSDIVIAPGGRWDIQSSGLRDTTYVAASGDRGWVIFGEGSRSPVGRVIMYDANADRISNVIQVTDILTNASETVKGIGLNHDGTLGIARGFQAYFFSSELRQQGVADLPAGGAGAAFHPLHANYPSIRSPGLYDPDTHLAFLGTGQGTIDIVDAFHFNRLGRIFIRDVVSGPLRAALPFPEDNAGNTCATKPVVNANGQLIGEAVDIFADANGATPHPAVGGATDDSCVVLKLYGVTTGEGVVVIDVRKSDILREHPARN